MGFIVLNMLAIIQVELLIQMGFLTLIWINLFSKMVFLIIGWNLWKLNVF